MDSKKDKVSERVAEVVVTPTPPQVMDPSSPPGKGRNEGGYDKGSKKRRDDKK